MKLLREYLHHKRVIIGAIILFLAFLAGVAYLAVRPLSKTGGEEKTRVTVGSHEFRARIADDEDEQRQGLMGIEIEALGQGEAMLFIFPFPDRRQFWNKNTLLDLDVIWILNGKVTGISFLPRESGEGVVTVRSPGKADAVVEIHAGEAARRGIKEGDKVRSVTGEYYGLQ